MDRIPFDPYDFFGYLASGLLQLIATPAKAASEGVSEPGEALFLHVRYHPSTLANEKLLARLGDFLNKYGFARNSRQAGFDHHLTKPVDPQVIYDLLDRPLS